MTIRRIAEEQRLSGAVVGGGLIWLAGQIADDAAAKREHHVPAFDAGFQQPVADRSELLP